jgi:hypothetical protein
VAFNTGQTATARFDVKEDSATFPALKVTQAGTGDILQVMDGTASAIIVKDGGNVGIGTTNPLQKLHVVGNTCIQGDAVVTGNWEVQGTTTYIDTYTAVTSNVTINNASGNGPALRVTQSGVGANYPIADFYDSDVSSTVPALRIADGGNVGIGTTDPLYKLHVYGRTSTIHTKEISFSGSDDQRGAFFWIAKFNDDPSTYTNTLVDIDYSIDLRRPVSTHSRNSLASGKVRFSALRYYSTTATASNGHLYTLYDQKEQTYYFQGRLPKWYYVVFNGKGYLGLAVSISDANVTSYNINAKLNFLTRDAANDVIIWNGTVAKMDLPATTELLTSISLIYPTIGTTDPNWDSTMTSASTATVFKEAIEGTIFGYGNVGIGTTTPLEKLHVQGNILSTGSIDAGTQFLGLATDTLAAPSFSFTGDANTGMYHPGADKLGLVTAGLERVSVLADGNVGIGTTNPQQKLHVLGEINTTSASINTLNMSGLITCPTAGIGKSYNFAKVVQANTPRWYKIATIYESQIKGSYRIQGFANIVHETHSFDVLTTVNNVSSDIHSIISDTLAYQGDNGLLWDKFGIVFVTETNQKCHIYLKISSVSRVSFNLEVTCASKNGDSHATVTYYPDTYFSLAFSGTMTSVIDSSLSGTIVNFDVYSNANTLFAPFIKNGYVGIGMTNPQAKLHVYGANGVQALVDSGGVEYQHAVFTLRASGTHSDNRGVLEFKKTQSGVAKNTIYMQNQTWTTANNDNQELGIWNLNAAGTTHTSLLRIGLGSHTFGAHGYLATGGAGSSASGGITTPVITANGDIHAYAFRAYSDIRIKKEVQPINPNFALESILKIQASQYKYIDEIKQPAQIYGFIAQQIASVFPYAVQTQRETIPSIYSRGVLLTPTRIKVDTYHGLVEGDKVKVLGDSDATNVGTVSLIIDSYTFECNTDFTFKETIVFVYGKEVDDFKTLNKEPILSVTVAALQEVISTVEILKKEKLLLESLVQSLFERIEKLEDRV